MRTSSRCCLTSSADQYPHLERMSLVELTHKGKYVELIEKANLTGRGELIYAAVTKMQDGERLYNQGLEEFKGLLGEEVHKKNPLLKKIKQAGKARKLATTIAHRKVSTFRKETRTDEQLMSKMVDLLKKNLKKKERVAGYTLFDELHIGERLGERILKRLLDTHLVRADFTDKGRYLYPWKDKAIPKVPAKKTLKKGKPGTQGTPFEVEPYIDKAIDIVKTSDWVTKGAFMKKIDLSFYPANKLLLYLKQKGLVKEILKKNNPSHSKNLAAFNREFSYWTAV